MRRKRVRVRRRRKRRRRDKTLSFRHHSMDRDEEDGPEVRESARFNFI